MMINIKRNLEVFGPYTVEEARNYILNGRLAPSDFAQPEGSSEWVPLGSVPGLQIAAPPPLMTVAPSNTSPSERGSNTPSSFHLGGILRDVATILALTFLGGFSIGLSGAKRTMSTQNFLLAISASNIFFGIVGFAISGRKAKGNRWFHLAYVAVGVWLSSAVNVVLGFTSVAAWLMSIPLVALTMGIGGGFSYLNKQKQE